MATMVQQQPQQQKNWKETSIQQASIISDLWDVIMAYAGHAARWILFVCMCVNIIQILPGVTIWLALQNVVLGTQVITLDIAGFSLSSLAKHVREAGEEKAAHKAEMTSKALIALMVATILLVTIGLLYPPAVPYTAMAEKALILVRVVMVVIYGHVIHSLRHTTTLPQPTSVPSVDVVALQHQITTLTGQVKQLQSNALPTPAPRLAPEESNGIPQPQPDASSIHLVKKQAAPTNKRGEALKRAKYILAESPNITPTELAKRASISRPYASQLINQKQQSA